MEGTWKAPDPRQRRPRPAHTARVVLETAKATAVGFSLGVVELLDRAAEDDVVGHLGPDLLGPDWDEERALANLTCDPQRPVREALLDQTNLAGIGNMYAAEPASPRACTHRPRSPPCPTCAGWSVGPIDARAQQGAAPPVDHRRPARAGAHVGLPPRPVAVPPLRHTSRRGPAWTGRTGARVVLVPVLSARTLVVGRLNRVGVETLGQRLPVLGRRSPILSRVPSVAGGVPTIRSVDAVLRAVLGDERGQVSSAVASNRDVVAMVGIFVTKLGSSKNPLGCR